MSNLSEREQTRASPLPWKALFFKDTKPLLGGKLNTLGPFYLILSGICLFCLQSLCQHHYLELMECLVHRHGISHIMISDQDTQFTVKKASKQARTMGSFGCIKAYYSEAAGLIECWYGLQKAKLKCQLRRNTLKGWNAILQDVYTQNIHRIRPDSMVLCP